MEPNRAPRVRLLLCAEHPRPRALSLPDTTWPRSYRRGRLERRSFAATGYGSAQVAKDCVSSIATSVDRYGGDTGQELVYRNDELEFGLANGIAPEVTAMKNAGVDLVMTCMDLNGVKTLEQAEKIINLTGQFFSRAFRVPASTVAVELSIGLVKQR